MANQEHIDLLKQGVEAWNQWRKDHRSERPDLRKAKLRRFDLFGVNLSKADLSSADLRRANLRKANLLNADLSGADLSGSSLSRTNLSRANLSRTDLSGADLNRAKLNGTDLTEARLGWTSFTDIDLSPVIGLDTVRTLGPSYLDITTIYHSKGRFPESFLRGIGVPDSFIEYMSSLVSNPLDYYTCFISYSSKDQAFAERLYADLQNKGVRCWFAPEDLKIGDHYHQRIDESIRLYDKLILILSEHAVQSAWVEREVVAAREKEDREQRLVLFPLRLDDAVMDTTIAWAADVRRRWHIGDFTQWKHHDAYQIAFERLLRDLKAGESHDSSA